MGTEMYITRIAVWLLVLVAPLTFGEGGKTLELSWEELIPEGYTIQTLEEQIDFDQYQLDSLSDEDPEAQRLYNDMKQLLANAPVVEQLAGVNVKIAGFVVPLEMEADRILSFLLVPYYGACIHTPPPPSNQIVFVETQGGFELSNPSDPVYVTGTMMIEHQESDLGSAGYTLYAGGIEPYL